MTLPNSKANKTPEVLYDGSCPVCQYFMSNMATTDLETIDARQPSTLKEIASSKNFDLDKGIVLADGERLYYGYETVQIILASQKTKSIVLRMMKMLFKYRWLAKISYPLFVGLRRVLLWWNGIPLINNVDNRNGDRAQGGNHGKR